MRSLLLTLIDLSGYQFDRAIIAWDKDSNLSEFRGTVSSGSFEGNQFAILSISISGASYLGLFGKVDSQAWSAPGLRVGEGICTEIGTIAVAGTRS